MKIFECQLIIIIQKQVMSWFSKKIIVGRLGKFFHIDNDANIEISILGKFELKCKNLVLKIEAVNKPTLPILVKFCRIGLLQVSFESRNSSKKSLNVLVDDVKIVVALNKDQKQKKEEKEEDKKESTKQQKKRPQLEQFYKAISTQVDYQQRSFLQEQIFQLMQLVTQYALSQLYLNIKNVDISLEYESIDLPKYIGIQIQQIQAKQELISVNNSGSTTYNSQNNIHCEITNLVSYIGVKNGEAGLFKDHQFLTRFNNIKKKYFLTHCTLGILLNLAERSLQIQSNHIQIDFQDILIHEFLKISQTTSDHFQKDIRYRPGQGPIVKVPQLPQSKSKYNSIMNMSEGTLLWWNMLGNSIVQKLNKRTNNNLISNKKYRRYLFCLVYRYTYGAHAELQKMVDKFEVFKTDLQIMKQNKTILNRIETVRRSKNKQQTDKEVIVFISFILSIQNYDPQLLKLRLKKVTYKDIKNSHIIINWKNCKKFIVIKQTQQKNSFIIKLQVKKFVFYLKRPKIYNKIKNDILSMTPAAFHKKKKKLLEHYCIQSILDLNSQKKPNKNTNQNQGQSEQQKSSNEEKKQNSKLTNITYIELVITNLFVLFNNGNETEIKLTNLQVNDKQSKNKIVKISNLKMNMENMPIQNYSIKTMTAQKRLEFNVDLIFVQVQTHFVEKLLTIMGYINRSETEVTEEEQKNFIAKFISKKVPTHPIFHSYKRDSKYLNVKKFIVAIPVFFNDRNFQLFLKGIQFQDNALGKITFDIEQSLISRSTTANTLNKIEASYRTDIRSSDDAIILANTRSYSGYIEQPGYIEENSQKSITNIILPFLLVQLSFQNIYYLLNIQKLWTRMLSNPYYFQPKRIKKRWNISQVNPNAIKFVKSMQTRANRREYVEITLEGIQFYLISDYLNEGNNKLIDMLVDNLVITSDIGYLDSQITIQLRDLFIRNALRFKGVNNESLVKCLKDDLKYGDEPVLYDNKQKQYASQQKNERMEQDKQLLLYGDRDSDGMNSQSFMRVQNISKVDLENKRCITEVIPTITPIYIFYSLEFFQMLTTIFSTIFALSSENLASYQLILQTLSMGLPFSYSQLSTVTGTGGMVSTTIDMNELKQKNQDIEILSFPQFQQVTTLMANIKKLNLLAVKNSSVVMTISLVDLRFQHKTQPYLQRIFFKAKRFIIVDTSLQTGTHPKIIDTRNDKCEYSITGSFTKYKSEIIRHRQKKSAYFELDMQAPQIQFLKKKVLQLTTFLMIVLRQTGVLAPPNQPAPPKQKMASNQPPLRYKININYPKIILHRSSLSQQGFKSEADSIIVTNCPVRQQKLQQSSISEEQTQRNNHSEFMQFQNNLGDEKNLFASFEHEGDNQDKQTTQKIYITLRQYKIYSTNQWHRSFSELTDFRKALRVRPFLDFQAINIEFCSPEMAVNIPIIQGNMIEQDYRVLMRFTEQNLGQTPLLFVEAPRPQIGKKISFRTLFNFETTQLNLNVEEKSVTQPDKMLVKIVKLTLDNLVGKNQLWTNGQIFTDLSIYNMMLTAVGNVQVLRRLQRQYTKQLPQLPKSKAYTDITDNITLKEINKMAKKSLNEILTTQNQQGVKQFKNEEPDQFQPEDQIGAQQKTNTGRIGQWFKGMFKKCFKCRCCRKAQKQKKHRQNRNTNKAEQEQDENIKLKDNKYKNRKANIVYKMEDILDFDYEIDWDLVQDNKKKQNMVYLSFVIQPNGQKQMYMLAKQMQVLIQNTKSLLGVIPFFGKPYSVYDVPKQVRKYKFNNNKPFKMLIEVDDTLAEIKTINDGKEQKICIICDAVYDSESRGDATMGPGLSKLRIQSVARIFYVNQKYKQPVNLSDNFKVVYISQTKIPYIQLDQRNKTKQIIMLSPHEAKDRNVSFFIPAFTLKSLNRIISDNFLKVPSQDKKRREQQQLIETMMEEDISANQVSKTIKKSKHFQRANTIQTIPQIKISGLQMVKNRSQSAKFEPNIRQITQKQQRKVVPAPPAPVIRNTEFTRLIYIDELTFQIESKLQSSFVKTTIDSIKYNEVFVNNKEFKRNIRNIFGQINVTYWNLKLGVFQPCIEPWNFRVIQDVYVRDNLSSSSLKIMSDLQKKKGDAYVNDLNINISVALFQIYKELMIYYEQQTYDENQECIFLNEVDSDYDTLFNRNKNPKVVDLSLKVENNQKKKNFPQRLYKYFTRIFVPIRHNINKYLKGNNKYYFNPPGCRLFLYHSYFDHFRRKKCITYRTPYRIMNSTNVDLVLWFYDPKYQNSWKALVRMSEYYAVPQQIYSSDLLLHVTDQDTEVFPQSGPFVSVKYLIQMRAKKKNFTKIGPESAVWKNIFKYSSPQTQKYIDFRDMIIRIGNRSFIAISVFSKHELKQQEQCLGGQQGDLKYYDAYCILQSPIIIDNYTHLDLSLTVNNTKIIKINKNEKIQINQNLSERVSETAIQFLNDSIHEERRILFEKYGQTCKTMEIQKLQSVKLKITRQTTSSVLIKIYTEWNISNYTKQNFSIRNNQKLLILDKFSFNCLSNISQKGIDICILHNEEHKKKIKPNNIADVITLSRMITEDDEKSTRYRQRRIKQQRDKQQQSKIEEERRRQHQNKNKILEINSLNKRKSSHEQNMKTRKPINKQMRPLSLLADLRQKKQQYLSKQSKMCRCFSNSEMIYEQIDFVLNVKADPIEQVLTQKIIIRYRYQIRNLTSYNINLCQHDNTFLIAEMPPYVPGKNIEPQYIFYYDFLPQIYFFQVFVPGSQPTQVGKTLCSCPFKMDQFPGSTFIIKIKKEGVIETEEYQKRYFYLRIQIKKIEEETLIEVKEGDTKDFPIYIDNLTDHAIKIVENQDEFILKSQSRVPFAWSHLMSNDYKLQVSIQGVGKQTYLFNNKSAFQPLKIVDKSQKKKRRIEKLYLKQICYVKYEYLGIETVCLVILDLFDNKLRIHNKQQNINMQVNMNDVQKIAPLASKIEIYFENSQLLQLMPPSRSIKNWIKNIQECVNEDVIDKIFFTIESYDNSRILFFRTIGDEQFSSNKMECSIDHLNLSLIGPQPEQIILLYCGNISLIQHDKQNKLNYKNLELHQSEMIMTVKKLKVSNQMKDAVNPVVISQIKKSTYPFMELRLVRQRLQLQNELKIKQSPEKQLKYKQEEERITHYKEVSFFIDEAQVMVEAALFLKLFSSKKHFDHVNNQYAFGVRLEDKDQEMKKVLEHARKSGRYQQQVQKYRKSVALVNLPKQQEEQSTPPQVYINYLQIKPIKMTISVYLDHNSEQDIQMNFISILRYIPFGIQNAIVQLQCCQFFHVFYDRNQLKSQILKYYSKQAFNQIYKNAGSYDMFVPIQLVGGLGNGVKKIFYDPIYELVKKKEIKAVGKTFCEGILSFIIFLFGFLIKLINVIFKMLAFFTFDQVFKTRRQAFRKQIFKSPGEGTILGAKYFLQQFKSFFTAFTQIENYYSGCFIFGYIYGFFICIIKVIPWGFKLVVSLYDWLFVIGCGLVNWGYYEQSAMKTRSRPRRTFYHKEQIIDYNYFHSLAIEIIQNNQLEEMRNEQIYFVESIKGGQDSNHLILSNYRIIHNYNRFTSMQEIKLYQLNEVFSRYSDYRKMYKMFLRLTIPNVHKFFFIFSFNVSQYKLSFASIDHILFFLKKLKILSGKQDLNVNFIEEQPLKPYFKNFDQQLLQNFILSMNIQQIKTKDYYDKLEGQNIGQRNKYIHALEQNETKEKKKTKKWKEEQDKQKEKEEHMIKSKSPLLSNQIQSNQ